MPEANDIPSSDLTPDATPSSTAAPVHVHDRNKKPKKSILKKPHSKKQQSLKQRAIQFHFETQLLPELETKSNNVILLSEQPKEELSKEDLLSNQTLKTLIKRFNKKALKRESQLECSLFLKDPVAKGVIFKIKKSNSSFEADLKQWAQEDNLHITTQLGAEGHTLVILTDGVANVDAHRFFDLLRKAITRPINPSKEFKSLIRTAFENFKNKKYERDLRDYLFSETFLSKELLEDPDGDSYFSSKELPGLIHLIIANAADIKEIYALNSKEPQPDRLALYNPSGLHEQLKRLLKDRHAEQLEKKPEENKIDEKKQEEMKTEEKADVDQHLLQLFSRALCAFGCENNIVNDAMVDFSIYADSRIFEKLKQVMTVERIQECFKGNLIYQTNLMYRHSKAVYPSMEGKINRNIAVINAIKLNTKSDNNLAITTLSKLTDVVEDFDRIEEDYKKEIAAFAGFYQGMSKHFSLGDAVPCGLSADISYEEILANRMLELFEEENYLEINKIFHRYMTEVHAKAKCNLKRILDVFYDGSLIEAIVQDSEISRDLKIELGAKAKQVADRLDHLNEIESLDAFLKQNLKDKYTDAIQQSLKEFDLNVLKQSLQETPELAKGLASQDRESAAEMFLNQIKEIVRVTRIEAQFGGGDEYKFNDGSTKFLPETVYEIVDLIDKTAGRAEKDKWITALAQVENFAKKAQGQMGLNRSDFTTAFYKKLSTRYLSLALPQTSEVCEIENLLSPQPNLSDECLLALLNKLSLSQISTALDKKTKDFHAIQLNKQLAMKDSNLDVNAFNQETLKLLQQSNDFDQRCKTLRKKLTKVTLDHIGFSTIPAGYTAAKTEQELQAFLIDMHEFPENTKEHANKKILLAKLRFALKNIVRFAFNGDRSASQDENAKALLFALRNIVRNMPEWDMPGASGVSYHGIHVPTHVSEMMAVIDCYEIATKQRKLAWKDAVDEIEKIAKDAVDHPSSRRCELANELYNAVVGQSSGRPLLSLRASVVDPAVLKTQISTLLQVQESPTPFLQEINKKADAMIESLQGGSAQEEEKESDRDLRLALVDKFHQDISKQFSFVVQKTEAAVARKKALEVKIKELIAAKNYSELNRLFETYHEIISKSQQSCQDFICELNKAPADHADVVLKFRTAAEVMQKTFVGLDSATLKIDEFVKSFLQEKDITSNKQSLHALQLYKMKCLFESLSNLKVLKDSENDREVVAKRYLDSIEEIILSTTWMDSNIKFAYELDEKTKFERTLPESVLQIYRLIDDAKKNIGREVSYVSILEEVEKVAKKSRSSGLTRAFYTQLTWLSLSQALPRTEEGRHVQVALDQFELNNPSNDYLLKLLEQVSLSDILNVLDKISSDFSTVQRNKRDELSNSDKDKDTFENEFHAITRESELFGEKRKKHDDFCKKLGEFVFNNLGFDKAPGTAKQAIINKSASDSNQEIQAFLVRTTASSKEEIDQKVRLAEYQFALNHLDQVAFNNGRHASENENAKALLLAFRKTVRNIKNWNMRAGGGVEYRGVRVPHHVKQMLLLVDEYEEWEYSRKLKWNDAIVEIERIAIDALKSQSKHNSLASDLYAKVSQQNLLSAHVSVIDHTDPATVNAKISDHIKVLEKYYGSNRKDYFTKSAQLLMRVTRNLSSTVEHLKRHYEVLPNESALGVVTKDVKKCIDDSQYKTDLQKSFDQHLRKHHEMRDIMHQCDQAFESFKPKSCDKEAIRRELIAHYTREAALQIKAYVLDAKRKWNTGGWGGGRDYQEETNMMYVTYGFENKKTKNLRQDLWVREEGQLFSNQEPKANADEKTIFVKSSTSPLYSGNYPKLPENVYQMLFKIDKQQRREIEAREGLVEVRIKNGIKRAYEEDEEKAVHTIDFTLTDWAQVLVDLQRHASAAAGQKKGFFQNLFGKRDEETQLFYEEFAQMDFLGYINAKASAKAEELAKQFATQRVSTLQTGFFNQNNASSVRPIDADSNANTGIKKQHRSKSLS